MEQCSRWCAHEIVAQKTHTYGNSLTVYLTQPGQSSSRLFGQGRSEVGIRMALTQGRQSERERAAGTETRGSVLMGKQESAGRRWKSRSGTESWDHDQDSDEAGEAGTG